MEIVIADDQINENGRRYSNEALQSMALGLLGKPVVKHANDTEQGDLGDLVGIVELAVFAKGAVTVSVRMFAGYRPDPAMRWLTPSGVGMIADGVVNEYKCDRLVVSSCSAFSGATKMEA